MVRQEALITRFNDLYLRDRLSAMDILRTYSDNYENNQRIVFSAVQVKKNLKIKMLKHFSINHFKRIHLVHLNEPSMNGKSELDQQWL